jgi:NB-ARC domain
MVTIRASEPGITQVDRARRRKGWLKQSEIWCRTAHTSRATLKRFWRREPIDQGAFIAIYQAVGIEEWEAMAEVEAFANQMKMDLSAMPDIPVFFGRSSELKNITDWSAECRLIALWGIGGIGKTALTAEWVESQVSLDTREDQFEAVLWVSIHAESSLATLTQSLAELLKTDATQIFTLLQHHRILLVLDNWEMLLGGGTAGQVKAEFQEFSRFFQQLGIVKHNSCVIIISSEKPAELALLEGLNPYIKSLKVEGLGNDSISLLRHRELQEEQAAWDTLIQLYRGHPLALNMIASLIQEICQGSTSAFLKMNTIVVHQLDNVIGERVRHLSTIELDILRSIAQSVQPVTREWLCQQFTEVTQSQSLEILLSLERRCLLEIISEETNFFTLSPVVRKYILQKASSL